MNKNLIVNADDFGLSSVVNRAIIYCLNHNIINSTSLMTNTPGFEEAVDLAKANNYHSCIGIHINLTEGRPLTNFNHSSYLLDDGSWNKSAVSRSGYRFEKKIREDFSKEIIAQIETAQKKGITPSHINSHHHVHTLPPLFFLFLNICESYKYKLRIAQTHFSGSYLKMAYRKYINTTLKRKGLQFSDYFETVQSYNERKEILKNKLVEVMVHPSFNEKGVLTDTLNDSMPQNMLLS